MKKLLDYVHAFLVITIVGTIFSLIAGEKDMIGWFVMLCIIDAGVYLVKISLPEEPKRYDKHGNTIK